MGLDSGIGVSKCSVRLTHMGGFSMHVKKFLQGPAVSIMAMPLNSHVANHGSRPGPCGLNSHQARVCACMPKIPRGEWRRRDCGMTIPPPRGVISRFVSLSLSLSFWRAHMPYSKNLSKIYIHVFLIFLVTALLRYHLHTIKFILLNHIIH